MLKLVKNYLNNFVLRLAFLLIVLLVVLGVASRPFVFVKAFSSRINVLPENFTLEQDDDTAGWSNVSKSFYQDLSNEAQFADFNQDNSAFIISNQSSSDNIDLDSVPVDGNEDASDEDSVDTDTPKTEEKIIDVPATNILTEEEKNDDAPMEDVQENIDPADTAEPDIIPSGPQASEPEITPSESQASEPQSESAPEASASISEATESAETSFLGNFNLGISGFFNDLKKLFASESALAIADIKEQKITYSNFSVPESYEANTIGKVNLRLSLAAESAYENDRLLVEYKLGDEWQALGEIGIDKQFVNAPSGDFFNFTVPNISDWKAFDELKIRVNYVSDEIANGPVEKDMRIFLDALWLEIDYDDGQEQISEITEEEIQDVDVEETDLEESPEMLQEKFELKSENEKRFFRSDEIPTINYKFREKHNFFGRILESIGGIFYDKYKNIKVRASVMTDMGSTDNLEVTADYIEDGEIAFRVKDPGSQFAPGAYRIKFGFREPELIGGAEVEFDDEFVWGVLAFNADKASYLPGETAYLQMASLDSIGHTLCDSNLVLDIETPSGKTETLSVGDGTIFLSSECGADNVTDAPDYFVHYPLSESGRYRFKLTNLDNNYSVEDFLTVQDERPFLLERTGATRINPFKSAYIMKISFRPEQDFQGYIEENLPSSFRLAEISGEGQLGIADEIDGTQKISWPVSATAGETIELYYTYLAPKISPQFYLLGSLSVYGLNGDRFYAEERSWQIAADSKQAFTGDSTFVVPPGVTSITAKVWGAGGAGGGGGNGAGRIGGGGGGGGFAQGAIPVTPGETLTIRVGGAGDGGNDDGNVGEGGGGGGYSAILRSGTFLIQAGGGAGGAGAADGNSEDGGGGGAGSGANGSNGSRGLDAACGSQIGDNGDGGTTAAGGVGGSGCSSETDGQAGSANQGGGGGNGDDTLTGGATGGTAGANGGGAGGDGQTASNDPGGGGGGGGQYGGGGGEAGNAEGAGGGGGGSGKTDGLTAVITAAGTAGGTGAGGAGAAANNGDVDYAGSAGTGGAGGNNARGSAGYAGRIVVLYDNVEAAATGSQTSILEIPSASNYVGGSFVLRDLVSTSSISGITLTEIGTVNAQTSLSNIRLFYDLDTSAPYNCLSESFSESDARYGATSSSFSAANGTASFAGSVTVSTTSAMCVYAVLDVARGATDGQTLKITINNPSTDITGPTDVGPNAAISAYGTTTLAVAVSVAATGTQAASLDGNSENNYIGGAFVISNAQTARNLTSISINESGTVDAASNLSNIRLYYDLDTSAPYNCVGESFSASDLRFGATSTAFDTANGTSTFSGAANISTTSAFCAYVVLDIGSGALKDETIEIEISSPATGISLSSGLVYTSAPVAISGTTNIYTPDIIVSADKQRKNDLFTLIANQGWTNENEINLSALSSLLPGATTSRFNYYFELKEEDGSFIESTSEPSGACADGADYSSCATKIWTNFASTTPWYDSNWGYRKKLIINAAQVATTTSGFVVLATTTDSNLRYTGSGGHVVSANGYDITLIDSDGTTKLDYEREYYNSATGQLVIWVETDVSSTTNKTIYIYYGNSAIAVDQQNQTGTWNSSYAVVNHLKDDPGPGTAGGVRDSTSFANNATASGDMTSADLVSGMIGQAIDFDGVSDTLTINDSASMDGTTGAGQARTFSYWLNFTTVVENTLITDKSNFAGTALWSEAHASPNKIRGGTGGGNQLVSDTIFSTGQWYYVVFEHSGGNDRLYVNGVLDDGPNAQTAPADNNNVWNIMGAGTNYEVNGKMDELRATNITHTAGWILTEYNNQHDVEKFMSIEDEESIAGATYEGIVNVVSLPDRGSSTDSAIGYKWQVLACNFENQCSNWDDFNGSIPNFKVDTDAPSAPGDLVLATTTATTITLAFGAETNEANFAYYRIFYKTGLSGVDTDDSAHSDANLAEIDYSGATSTTILNLESDTQYVINIWAYDLAGNKTSANEIVVSTQSAPHARARSVQFLAGDYSSANGLSGQNTDTAQSFATFNFSLAETGVEVRSAYVLFEAQFEAYNALSSDYTGYEMSFDACVEPCTANATNGSGRAFIDSDTVLAYDEADSNQVRILFDVTDEAQLAAYAGDSANMQAQVGYNLQTGTAVSSIASTRAILVVSYAFNEDATTNFTNTVIYPLESAASGDSGTKRASTADDCDTDLNTCPTFNYNIEIPEIGAKLSQWFTMGGTNDGHGINDVAMTVNLQGYGVESDTYYHEAANGGEQGHFPAIIFDNVYGYTENSSQVLEYYLSSPGTGTYYLLSGESTETYTAPKSASVKTRTVSFPIGVLTNGQSTSLASGSASVYFPENGTGDGIVDIKKAWFRIFSNDYASGLYTLTVSSKTGSNSTSANYVYNIDAGDEVIKPSFKIIHVIPSADYSELELANASIPKEVVINTTNSSTNIGGVSAELMITYSYTDESSGYLSSLNLFGGQSGDEANSQNDGESTAFVIFPEKRGVRTVRSAGLLGSFLFTDSDGDMPANWFTIDINISTTSPVCSPSGQYGVRSDGANTFAEYFKSVTPVLSAIDEQAYFACYSNENAVAPTAGARMNSILFYTYQWTAPLPELIQSNWRWYGNSDSLAPGPAKAAEKTAINGVNIGDILRVRMNIAVTKTALATSTQAYTLQYVESDDCLSVASTSWSGVGGVSADTAWRGYNNPDPADNSALASVLLSTSNIAQSYEEANNSASNPRGTPANGYAEWDWVLYNNFATSSSNYCFRMIKSDGSLLDDYASDSFPTLATAASNTPPSAPLLPMQYRGNGTTTIANGDWINTNTVVLSATATDPNMSEIVTLYFELASSTASFTTATQMPSSSCPSGTAYSACASKIWRSNSVLGDYRTSGFIGTTSISSLPDYNGYKWQVIACDDDNACSVWTAFDLSVPNFKVDNTSPTIPGNLQAFLITPISMIITLGASSSDVNFSEYRMYYKVGTSGVTESDEEHEDNNFSNVSYANATSTFVIDLAADTDYVFNIWAYDHAGNKAAAAIELTAKTANSFNPPTGYLMSSTRQRTDGSGIVDVTILADDADNNDTLRAKFMFNSACDFSGSYGDSTIDETDSNTFATYGDPKVNNANPFQIGTTTGWIKTSPGQNYVFFDWLSNLDLPAANGEYCMGLVVSDGVFEQVATHTRPITLDNVKPTVPGYLTLAAKDSSSVTLKFGTSSIDTNFRDYKIYYKIGTSGVTENDFVHSTSSDINLDEDDFNLATTTTISGLDSKVEYVFNIWAYDTFGNRASSTIELSVKTNAAPTNISADNQYYSDSVTPVANGSWMNDNSIILKASTHDQDSADLVTFYYELVTATSTFNSFATVPSNICAYGTAFEACSSRIWSVSTTSSSLPADWYDGDWLYRKQITINSAYVATTTADFPVMIDMTDADLADEARADGFDILITDSSGTALLDYEREYFNPISGQFVAWVKTDVSSTTDTILYLYYGNAEVTTDPSTVTEAWDSYFRGVWHLEENVVDEATSFLAHNDSTAYANHGDQYGNNEFIAKIYQGQDFDGANDYLNIADNNSLDLTSAMTMSFWMNGEIGTEPVASSSVYTSAGTQTFTVPVGVTKITVKAWGAGGGGGGGANGGAETNRNPGGDGGGGGYILSTINVVPGETLTIAVGGGGGGGAYNADASSGGGGGGRTAVLRSTSLLLAAGGGAGGGGGSSVGYTQGANGGPGGGTSGTAGSNTGVANGGGGGTQIAGGTAGTGSNNGTAGALTNGGAGADGRIAQGADGGGGTAGTGGGAAGGLGDASNRYGGAGGGAGGYYGGGGGGAGNGGGAGGGGGSSYATSTAIATSTSAGSGINPGNSSDEDYLASAGVAGSGGNYLSAGSVGNPGLVVIEFTPAITIAGKGTDAYQISLNSDNYISAQINSQSVSTPISSGWHHIALTYDQNAGGTAEMKLLLDGVVKSTADYSTAINANTSPIIIGSAFNGTIDEMQISNFARHPSWIETAYNNQNDNSSFLTIGSEGTVASYFESALIVSVPDNPDFATGYKWQVKACDDDGDCTSWDQYNPTTPNFKIDTTNPSAPGQLTENSKTSNSVTLNYGSATDEDNFTEYRVYYSTNPIVTEADSLYGSTSDANLLSKTYNGITNFTINNLNPATTYYFNIWAYDVVGHKASSTVTSVDTNDAVSTPGIMFYAKNDRAIYYRVWDGAAWGTEQSSGNVTALGDNIRHIRTIRSDNGAKIGLLIKTWDGTNQDWYGAVYRYAADDFVNVSALGTSWASATNNDLMTACITPLSGGEFVIVRNNNAGNGAIAFSWDGIAGWTSEGLVPGTDTTGKFGVMNGCNLVRRPGTDNYLLLTFDDTQYVGSMYYFGGSTFDNSSASWTSWVDHASAEEDINNFVGDAFFDPSNNSRGALYYSNSTTNNYAYAKYFTCAANSINFGGSQPSPAVAPNDWGGDFVHGEFASDPGGTGIAYFVGRDVSGQLNAYQVNASNPTISWSTVTNGDNISSGNLYSQANYAQTPFATKFYKSGKGLVLGNYSSALAPFYSVITTSGNTLSATTSVEGAEANIYPRVRLYDDPNEDEVVAIFQNDDIDYSAAFWDPGNERFYNSGNQAWTQLVTGSGAADADFESTSFGYVKYNSAPLAPTNLEQYKSSGTTTIANLGWTNESTVRLSASVFDIDTREAIRIYLQLITNNDTFATTSDYTTFNPCASSASWTDCNSKIWLVASSTSGDYSVTPYTATATITSIASSTIGYKWQMLSCDDEDECSTWQKFNAVTPNFYVDTEAPSAPGNLSIGGKTSQTVTLTYGAPTNEPAVSFLEYKIFYKIGASGVTEANTPWTQANDANLSSRTYNGATFTTINGLASSTQYVFNIWAYDKAGNKATATVEIATTTSALPAVRQSSFIWENDNGANVNSNVSATAASTTLSNIKIGTRLAARLQIENIGGDDKLNNIYKLQYENYTDAAGTWLDVTSTTSVSYGPGLSGANNDAITAYKAEANARTWHNGAWQENTGTTGNISLAYNEYTELVFMINTSNATTSKTYRLRVYDVTENKVLADYAKYPVFSTVASDTTRYSKGLITPLPTVKTDLEYYFDPLGYNDVLTDNSIYDTATSAANFPVFLFATKHTNSTDAASSTWNGQSSVSTITNTAILQVYRYGTTNAWVTVDTEATIGANIDFTLSGGVNSSLSEYYGPNNWIYWRVYQVSGTEALRTDFYNANFAPAVPDVSQLHYRWRADNGTEATATWLEDEDANSPTTGSEIGVGSTTRLRIEVANTGGGSATDYNYRLEYASSSLGCATDPGDWRTVPVTVSAGEHFEMIDSAYFGDGTTTVARFANSETYTFVAGDMVEDPTNASANLSLTEGRYTEIEYAFSVTSDADAAQTYCFRVTRNGAVLNNYAIYPSVTLFGSTNIAPAYSVLPGDYDSDGASASTSPTNMGDNITFRATAGDVAGDQYYLAICKSASISAGNDTAPTCNGGAWCVSTATASGTEASCVYTAATTTESNTWYAYVCDKVFGFGQAKCSAYSQGASWSAYASPFAINHAPNFTSVATVENNKNPGQTYRVTAYVTDTDVDGGADTMDFFVCGSAGATVAGCTGSTLCSELATTSPNASCVFATTTPALAGNYDYYAYIFDSHDFPASPASRNGTYTVNNTAPVLGTLFLNNGTIIILNIKDAPDTSISAINSSIEDLNGCQDIESAVSAIYMSNATNGYNCTADDNVCYQIAPAGCVLSNCDGPTDMIATYTCTAGMKYFAVPTDNQSANNPWKNYQWLSYLNVFDGVNYSATTSVSGTTTELQTNLAIEVPEQWIDFGTGIFAGENTGTNNSTTTIENAGNSPLDANIQGTNLGGVSYAGSIDVEWIKFDLTIFDYELGTNVLKTTNKLVDVVAPRSTSSATPSSDIMYWGIGIPPVAYPDTYIGRNTFIAVMDDDNW